MIKAMVNVYYRLVKSGSRTLEDIPEEYREAVKALIEPKTETGGDQAE
jgi:hypothetical protein